MWLKYFLLIAIQHIWIINKIADREKKLLANRFSKSTISVCFNLQCCSSIPSFVLFCCVMSFVLLNFLARASSCEDSVSQTLVTKPFVVLSTAINWPCRLPWWWRRRWGGRCHHQSRQKSSTKCLLAFAYMGLREQVQVTMATIAGLMEWKCQSCHMSITMYPEHKDTPKLSFYVPWEAWSLRTCCSFWILFYFVYLYWPHFKVISFNFSHSNYIVGAD